VRNPGFQWFVAWRYLMARPRRLSGTILVFTAVFAFDVVASAFALGLQPLTDNFIASGLPLPSWTPLCFGAGMALAVVFPYALAIKMGWLPQRGPTRADLERAAGGLAGRRRAASRKIIVGAIWLVVGSAVTAITYQVAVDSGGGVYLVAYGPVLFGIVQIVWGLGEYFDTGDVHQRFVRAPAWGRHGGAAVFFAGLAGLIGAAAGGGTEALVPGAVLLALAPLVVILSGATLSPRAIPLAIPVLVALGGLIALAVIAFASSAVGEGELFDNLPGLIESVPAYLSPLVLAPLAGALGALAAAFHRPWRSRAIPVAALFAALVPAAVAFLFWWRMTGYGLGELEMSGSGIEYHHPMWLTLPAGIGVALVLITLCLLVLRYFFTFFTTVSMGGVMMGSMALVITLSVMSGFETDLRQKILGSNAHVLVSREDEAAFTEYRQVMQKVERTPGVVALTPYLSSEVVIAGASNYFNVVIKGIDPRKIARVTHLGEDLEDADSLDRMYPLHGDAGVAGPPPDAAPPDEPGDQQRVGGPDASDPAPDDLDVGDVPPTDWSAGATESPEVREPEVVDPAPKDLQVGATDPTDWSGGATESPEPPPVADAGPSSEPLIEEPDDEVDRHEPAGRDEVRVGGDWSEPLEREIPPEVAILPGVLVGRELVKQINLFPGQEVKVISPLGQNTLAGQTPYIKPYRVAGVFFTGMYEYDLKLIYVELSTLQDFLDLPDVATGIEIRVDDPEDTEAVVGQLRAALGPAYRIQDWKELNRSLFSALKLEKIAMFLVLAIIILVASFSIVGNLIMVVVEKAREIAVLKTLGASDSGVTRIFSVQGFFIGLVGTAIGVCLGLLACVFADTYGIGIPPDVYYIDRLPVHVDMWSVLQVGAAGLVISIAATIYPAQIASRLRPVEGLRYE